MNSGFVVVDKPAGITSHDVVSRVRRIFGTRRVGHTGTLDPFATGVLPVAVNDGTKAIPFLDEGIKVYEAVMQLGVATDTLDTTGVILHEAGWDGITRSDIADVLEKFCGPITQIPPMYSAIKRDGQPLYKLARQGQTVEREPRPVEIYSLELTAFEPPLVSFTVSCSRGTYVRTLADDIGSSLGCGAALKKLRRTASGPFSISSAVTVGQLEQAAAAGTLEQYLLSPSAALAHLPGIQVNDQGRAYIGHGRFPVWQDIAGDVPRECEDGCLMRLIQGSELLAVAEFRSRGDSPPLPILRRVFLVS